MELIGAAGIDHPYKINRTHVYRRVLMNLAKTYEEIYHNQTGACKKVAIHLLITRTT